MLGWQFEGWYSWVVMLFWLEVGCVIGGVGCWLVYVGQGGLGDLGERASERWLCG